MAAEWDTTFIMAAEWDTTFIMAAEWDTTFIMAAEWVKFEGEGVSHKISHEVRVGLIKFLI